MSTTMNKYLNQHDPVYEKAPGSWSDGIPLGNGDLGVMLWQMGDAMVCNLDKQDLWENRIRAYDDRQYNYQTLRRLVAEGDIKKIKEIFFRSPRQTFNKEHHPHSTKIPLPRLLIRLGSSPGEFTARLVLNDAIVKGKTGFSEGALNWSTYVHADQNLFVFRFDAEGKGITPRVEIDAKVFDTECNHWGKTTINRIFEKWGYPKPMIGEERGIHSYYQDRPGQQSYAIAWTIQRRGSQGALFMAMISSNEDRDPLKKAVETVATAADKTEKILDSGHKKFWNNYWEKSYLTIPDSRLENLYYMQMYFLACCSRAGKWPCALQGVWTQGDGRMPPWCGCFSFNNNVQNVYWPIYAGNRLECGLPLYEQFWKLKPVFEKRCREFFGCEGIHLPTAVGLYGAICYGYAACDIWPGSAAWLAHHYWLHWRYSQDKIFLKERAYPFMRSAMQLYLHLLEKESDGKYHLPVSYAPEWYGDELEAWKKDVTNDLHIIRWLSTALIEATAILEVQDPDRARWLDVQANLVDLPHDENTGLHLALNAPVPYSQGIYGNLMGIWPFGNYTVEGTAREKEMIEKSLTTLERFGYGGWTGPIYSHCSMMAARSGRPNMAWKYLNDYCLMLRPNGMLSDGDFRQFGGSAPNRGLIHTMDGFALAAAIHEMLLQSWGGVIRIFPAMPEFWHAAYFRTLRAEGAFLVTAKMIRHKVIFIEIESEAGTVCRVGNPFEREARVVNTTTGASQMMSGNILEFTTKAGESFRLHPADTNLTPADLAPVMARRREEESNWFGLKELTRF